jgi:hypothetical protein
LEADQSGSPRERAVLVPNESCGITARIPKLDEIVLIRCRMARSAALLSGQVVGSTPAPNYYPAMTGNGFVII